MQKPSQTNPAIADGFVLGVAAFERGDRAVPALDKNLSAVLQKWNPTGEVGAGATIHILEGWASGWHTMNVRAAA